jgi:omega-amidase
MLADLSICMVQTDLVWENPEANLKHFDELLSKIDKPVDLIVLPEMFSTGFSMKPSLFANEQHNQLCIQQMKNWAARHQSVVCGSIMYAETGNYYNRFLWVKSDGVIQHYNKAHLFRMGEENSHYAKGDKQVLFELKNWKFACFVCYDLRFPVWLRRTPNFNFDAMLFVANWPARRNLHWQTLTRARAIENQSYVIAVNRIGMDGNQVEHLGNSAVFEPTGSILVDAESKNDLFYAELSSQNLTQYRTQFPVELDADSFELNFK